GRKKALLINPPTGKYMRDDRCQAPVESMTAQPARAPMDLSYMAATLEQAGLLCKIKDYPMEGKDWDDVERDLKRLKPDYLIISATTPTLDFDMKAAKLAKRHIPHCVTIAKGAHFAEKAKEVMDDYPELDIAIRGDCEFAVKEIAEADSHDDWSKVLGITFRKGSTLHATPERPRLEDLDSLPFPARHLLKNELYTAPDTGRPVAFIVTGRGCPHRCIYCAVSVASGYRLFMRSVKSVLAEIEDCYHNHGIKDFFFRSDTFTWDENWVVDLCKAIVDNGLDIRWGTNSRVDTVSDERLKWMKKAGCYVIGFGIESGNQEMLKKMKKATTLEQARKAIALCKKYKIKSYMLFMFGLPWETMETAEDTINFAKELDGDFADFNIAYPLPGTEFYDIAFKDKLYEGTLTGFDYGNAKTKSYHLTNEQLIALRKRAIREFYFRPRYILRTLWQNRSPRILFSYAKHGLALAWNLVKGKK
ncbi:TPA: radical SAM protein, partial [Candidatus Woesearchaeota archaeon]|nr:radical SAM protein [Candidatus Woesearchaeota archaeon]